VGTYKEDNQVFVIASIFSDNGCHDVPTTVGPSSVAEVLDDASVLVGSAIHWLLWWGQNKIQFDLVTQSLAVFENERPAGVLSVHHIHLDSGGVALATLYCSLRDQEPLLLQTWE
jgi:hypothetical protein